MRIVVADDLPASALDLLRAEGWTIDAQSGRTPDQLKIDLADADALVVRSATKVTPDIIAAAPKLRAIARAGTGVDNVHVETASARGIVVMNAPGANSICVAELAMAQILSLARKLPAADASMKQGVWDKKSFLGEEVRGKVLGLAGLGRIGQEVARRAQAFEMTVIAHDPFIAQQAAADMGIELVSLDDLCARADYLSLHMPSTPQTKRTFNAERLAKCKKGLRLVNTARGDLIDEAALVGRDRVRPHRWRRARRLRERTDEGSHAAEAGHRWWRARTSRPPRAKARNWWASKPPRRCAISSRPASFATPSTSPPSRRKSSSACSPIMTVGEQLGALVGQMGEARIESVGVRYYGELAGPASADRQRRAGGVVQDDPVGAGDRGQRPRDRRGTRHRHRRVVELADAQLPQPAVGEAGHRRRGALGRRRRSRIAIPAWSC